MPRDFSEVSLTGKRTLSNDLFWTATTQFVIMIGTFLVYGLISRYFKAGGVGEYALVRRAIYFLQPVTLLGITVAVPRFLPLHKDKEERAQIATIGFAIVMLFSTAVAVITFYWRDHFANLLFGNPGATKLVVSFSAITVAFGFHSFLYSYFRGLMQMKAANTLDVMNSAVLPLAAFGVCSGATVAISVFVLAIASVLWTAWAAVPLWKEMAVTLRSSCSTVLTRSLLTYGLPRIPGDFALAGLLLGPPWLVAQASDLAGAGRLAIAQTLLMVPGAALSALSVLLLPYVSECLAAGDRHNVKQSSITLFHALLDNSIFFGVHVFIMADVVLRLWLGSTMEGAAEYVRVMMLAVPFYATYFVFRSVIDATTTRPITTINLLAAFGVFALLYPPLRKAGFGSGLAAAQALSVAYYVLGILTFLSISISYGVSGFFDRESFRFFLFNLLLAGGVAIARYLVSAGDAACVLLEVLALIIYIAVVIKLRRPWALPIFRAIGLAP